jgi:DNA-binding NarL/FixJ family response regulator
MINVLFVDPNEEERQKWAERLALYSPEYVVLQAADGRSGLMQVKSVPIDCVVLELDLPDRNGLSILHALVGYAHHPQIAVLVLTTFPLEVLFKLAIQNGAQACMRKDQISVETLDLGIRKAIAFVARDKYRAV